MSATTAKKKAWFKRLCEEGCQICGKKSSDPKGSLEFSHIVSKTDGGSDRKVNILALCSNCANSFDLILKPRIYIALNELNDGLVPESWRATEGRRNL